MGFMTYEELDRYLVLIHYMLKFIIHFMFIFQCLRLYFNLAQNLIVFYFTHNMQNRRNAFHTRGGHGMLKKYYQPRHYCFFFAFQ